MLPSFHLQISVFILSMLALPVCAQEGCTDELASNYDANAISNDGSCLYETTNYSLSLLTELENGLNENSGLAFIDNQLWMHNDSGNAAELYEVDTLTGAILATVEIANATNRDWEEFALDATYLYVGDFGNNNGDRTDLRIYRVHRADLTQNIISAEIVDFEFEDQTDFSTNNENHDFDCEAFFVYQDSLHLFTKNWKNNKTKHYVLPTTSGKQTAVLRDSFNVNGLITGADIDENGTVVLLGYTEVGATFMWLLFDYQETNFFSGNKRRIELGSALTNSQSEGITFINNSGRGLISGEDFLIFPPRLFSFESKQWTDPVDSPTYSIATAEPIRAYPNPFEATIRLELPNIVPTHYIVSLHNMLGQGVFQSQKQASHYWEFQIPTNLPKGAYILQLQSNSMQQSLLMQKK